MPTIDVNHDYDQYVAAKVRERRIHLGISQVDLAAHVGVTFQQIHKYERGINRISVPRLMRIAKTLGVAVSYFLEGFGEQLPPLGENERLRLEIARGLGAISDNHKLISVKSLVRSLAD